MTSKAASWRIQYRNLSTFVPVHKGLPAKHFTTSYRKGICVGHRMFRVELTASSMTSKTFVANGNREISLSLSLSLSHTHTHSLTLFLFLSLSLSLTHTHTHTHTHIFHPRLLGNKTDRLNLVNMNTEWMG